ncbi:MAG: universal stress protein [Nitrospiraceae bacterium]|nr:universal stress protein [Nitrospiraceae bacterium]
MKILLATDGSEHSENAARFLFRFKLTMDDEITVLHAIGWIPFQEDIESLYRNIAFLRKEVAGKILDSAVDILKPLPARMSTAIGEGFADKAIMDAAAASGADLIAMGARGLKGFGAFLLGSVTRAVASRSTKPVLVVKGAQGAAPEKLKILLATDGSDSALATADLLAVLPLPPDTTIKLVNVTWSAVSDVPERYIIEVDELVREEIARAREKEYIASGKLLEAARARLAKFKDISGETRIGDPAAEILAEADQFGADLIAMGCRGLRGIRGMMGSVSRRVLDHAKCSVLLGRMCGE